MLFILVHFILLCHSQCFVDSTVNHTTTLKYETASSICSDLVSKYTYNSNLRFDIFVENTIFYKQELIIEWQNYYNQANIKRTISRFGFYFCEVENLQIVKIKPNNLYRQEIYTDHVNNKMHFYLGCYNGTGCDEPSEYYVYAYSNSFTIFLEESGTNFNYLFYCNDNSINPKGYPYTFIGSYTSITISVFIQIEKIITILIIFKVCMVHFIYSLLSMRVMCLVIIMILQQKFCFLLQPSSSSRKDTDRIIIFNKDQIPYTIVHVGQKYNDTLITINSLFNYPDCNYNSSMFDLVLPSSSSENYSLSDDLLEWYSIIFTNSSQSIQINDNKTLIIDELDINQDDISFNGNVYIKSLTISSIGASFNVLDFNTVNFASIGCDINLFTIQSTFPNLESFG